MTNKTIQFLIIAILSVYLFYGIDIKEIDFRIFNIWGVVLTILALSISQILLAVRWIVMSKLSFKISLETIVVSSALNMLLPARLGEASKAFYLKKFYNFNYHKTISIIFIERFFDIVMLFLLMCFSAYLYFTNDTLKNSIIFFSILILLVIVFFNSKKAYTLIKKIPVKFARVYTQKIYKNINRLLKNPYQTLFITLLIWLFYLISNTLFFRYGVSYHLSFQDSLELFIFFTIALSIPLTPAGIGTFEGAIVLFLTHHGVNKTDALISATLYHLLIFGVDFVMLYIFLITKNIKLKELIKK